MTDDESVRVVNYDAEVTNIDGTLRVEVGQCTRPGEHGAGGTRIVRKIKLVDLFAFLTERSDVLALAWTLCNAERPLDGSTRFDVHPCGRHIVEARQMKNNDGKSS